MSVGGARAHYAYGHSTGQVTKANHKSSSEEAVPSVLGLLECAEVVVGVVGELAKLSTHDDGHNKAVDSNGFAEDDTD